MNNEQLNGLFEIIELILNKEPSIIDSFLFDSLEYYIDVCYSKDDKIDSLIDDIIDICSGLSACDNCEAARAELEEIYNEIKNKLN